jgi:hypothetical protein
LRIENTVRSGSVAGRAGVKTGGTVVSFVLDSGPQAPRAQAAHGTAAAGGIEALLALQSAEDPLFAKKKAMRRGNQLLDALDSIKADLLLGRVSEGRLNQLMALITSARERQLPDLDGVLDDIELRARVELAKFGRYPGA